MSYDVCARSRYDYICRARNDDKVINRRDYRPGEISIFARSSRAVLDEDVWNSCGWVNIDAAGGF